MNLDLKFELHKKWVETSGQEGEKLRLQEVDFQHYELTGVCLEQSYMTSCNFDNLSLNNMDFHASGLSSSTYNDAELVNCDFYKSDLSYTEFSNATLRISIALMSAPLTTQQSF
ncbi:pentapeptide repeat-containing protein [Paenibacillus sp. W4I10]|uniref:pentapeptide repeat-containing protein n=2 Tax=unclassified Paenibacillus TaxID=185978 RepID=UPI0035900837